MARHRQRQLFRRNATAVIADADQPHAALFQVDINPRGAGVQRVLDQFLDHGRGPLDHFASGDLVDQDLGKLADAHAHLQLTEVRGAAARGIRETDVIP
jgi:hypothetical protein